MDKALHLVSSVVRYDNLHRLGLLYPPSHQITPGELRGEGGRGGEGGMEGGREGGREGE